MKNTTNGLKTINFIKQLNPEKIGIVFHEDMDGIIGGVCIKAVLKNIFGEDENKVTYIPTQYGKDQILNFEKMRNFEILVFIDFCPSVMEIIELFENGNDNISIFDHHLSQYIKLSDNDKELNSLSKKYPGFGYYYDKSKAGCGIALEQFIENTDSKEFDINFLDKLKFASRYAEDRDLWKWEAYNSKEINAGLDIIMMTLEIKHDLEAWFQLLNGNKIEKFQLLEEIYPDIQIPNLLYEPLDFIQTIENIGISKVRYDNAFISKIFNSAKKGKIPKLNICGIEMFVLNNSNLISEVGNKLTELNYPSCQYFIMHEVKDGLLKEPELVLSFRSTNDLPDVSLVAKALGGGGHRNACGTSLPISKIVDLLNGNL